MIRLLEKIGRLNNYVNKTLSIAYYQKWELHSYADNSLFLPNDKWVREDTFEKMIDKAYKVMIKDKREKLK